MVKFSVYEEHKAASWELEPTNRYQHGALLRQQRWLVWIQGRHPDLFTSSGAAVGN